MGIVAVDGVPPDPDHDETGRRGFWKLWDGVAREQPRPLVLGSYRGDRQDVLPGKTHP